jgi:hypothetical protein
MTTRRNIQENSILHCKDCLSSWFYTLPKSQSQSQSYVKTDGQSTILFGVKPSSDSWRLLMWAPLSNERTGLSFTIAAGPRQRSHSRARIPRDSITMFYRLRLETPPTWRATSPYLYPQEQSDPVMPHVSYESQGYGWDIRTRLHVGMTLNLPVKGVPNSERNRSPWRRK